MRLPERQAAFFALPVFFLFAVHRISGVLTPFPCYKRIMEKVSGRRRSGAMPYGCGIGRDTRKFQKEVVVMSRDLKAYWKRNVVLMAKLLLVWATVSYGCGIVFVNELNAVHIGGFPLGFWFAQQGSIFTFVILIFVYVWRMSRLDREFDVHE
jgi:putative solute:sodium symporter small subunit